MTKLHQLYTFTVLWLLSVLGRDAVARIYREGHADGTNELRESLRVELVKVQVAASTDRMRAYNQGFADAMRFIDGDEPAVDAPIQRVM